MKSEKGITLISLTIYVIAMAVVIGIIAIVSTFFYSNMENSDDTVSPMAEYTKFNSFFSDEVNHEGIEVIDCGTTDNGQKYIVFSNEVQYTYIQANRAIYRNKVKIAKEIDGCEFAIGTNNGKRVVNVKFEAGGKTRENTYTLK